MLMTVIFHFEGKYFYNLSEKNQNFLFWLKKTTSLRDAN